MEVSCSQVNAPLRSPQVPAMHELLQAEGDGDTGGTGGGGSDGGDRGGGEAGTQQPVQSHPVTRIASQVRTPYSAWQLIPPGHT